MEEDEALAFALQESLRMAESVTSTTGTRIQVNDDEDLLAQVLAESRRMATRLEDEAFALALVQSSAMDSVATTPLPPLISEPKNLSELADEYATTGPRADLYRAKTRHLEQMYSSIRRVRGDGNCFYRGFHVSWMERLLQLPARTQTETCDCLVPSVSCRYADAMPKGRLREELLSLGTAFASRTRKLCEDSRTGGIAESGLMRAVSDSDAMEESLRWLRLLASAYMRAHREQFEPVCASEVRDFDAFLAAEVEAMGVEADEMQVRALTWALQLRVRVEYLDGASVPWSNRCGVHRFVVCGPSERTGPAAAAEARAVAEVERDALELPCAPLVACLLFRPGHYDMLSPREWAVAENSDASGEHLLPPPPPRPRSGERCSACSAALSSCVLCSQALCTAAPCTKRAQLADAKLKASAPPLFYLPPEFGPIASEPQPVCVDCLAGLTTSIETCSSRSGSMLYRCPYSLGQSGCTHLCLGSSLRSHTLTCGAESVSCPTDGCRESTTRVALEAHLSTCEWQTMLCEDCGTKLTRLQMGEHRSTECRGIGCPDCFELVPFRALADHRATSCPGRMVKCPAQCGASFAVRDAISHHEICLARVIPCVWKCGATVKREAMATHQADCPAAWLRCPGPGCGQQMRRSDAKQHWARCDHMPTLCPDCGRLVWRGEMSTHGHSDCNARQPAKFKCILCFNDEEIDDSFQPDCVELHGTNHRYCFECVTVYCKIEIEKMSENYDGRLRCPNPSCQVEIVPHQVQGLTSRRETREGKHIPPLDVSTHQKYERVLLNQACRAEPGYRGCPRNCGYGAIIGFNTRLECRKCEKTFCVAEGCGKPHSENISCAEHRRREQEKKDGGSVAMQALFHFGVLKKCRDCATPIEKKSGCQHMDCRCSAKFCWYCMQSHQLILDNDASFHRRQCLLWQPPATAGRTTPPLDSDCTRNSNGVDDYQVERPESNTHCACTHGCMCSSSMRLISKCQCGQPEAATILAQARSMASEGSAPFPLMPSSCICGYSIVECSGCKKTICRLCNRPEHKGEPCLEDQRNPEASSQIRRLDTEYQRLNQSE